jgi:DNA-binding protein HU-beta
MVAPSNVEACPFFEFETFLFTFELQSQESCINCRRAEDQPFTIYEKGEDRMNKGDLVNEVAKVVNTKREAQEAVDCIFSTITQALKKKGTVTLVGFGTFKVSKRKARKGRNPQTGEEIKIKAKSVPKFLPGKALKDAVG